MGSVSSFCSVLNLMHCRWAEKCFKGSEHHSETQACSSFFFILHRAKTPKHKPIFICRYVYCVFIRVYFSLHQSCTASQLCLKFQVAKKKLFLPAASQMLILSNHISYSLVPHLLNKSLG